MKHKALPAPVRNHRHAPCPSCDESTSVLVLAEHGQCEACSEDSAYRQTESPAHETPEPLPMEA